eukprot:1974269-Rhodomonas_salina.1
MGCPLRPCPEGRRKGRGSTAPAQHRKRSKRKSESRYVRAVQIQRERRLKRPRRNWSRRRGVRPKERRCEGQLPQVRSWNWRRRKLKSTNEDS